jgi:hypothetical protein
MSKECGLVDFANKKDQRGHFEMWLRWTAAFVLLGAAGTGDAAEKTEPPKPDQTPIRAARSVHLSYQAPEAVLYYNEVVVEQSQKGSYFSVCGFNHGYFGIQERIHDKVVIFSVWDPGKQDNPDAVEEEQRVQLLHKDEDVYTGRFGGEGTGGQSFLTYDWKPGETYKFCVTAAASGSRTEFAAYFYMNETSQWKHLVTFSTLTNGDILKGYYSFIEDFRRDVKSAGETRRARFGNGWVKTAQGHWISLTQAKFTADANPLMTINAGAIQGGFFLQTGGETANQTPLWSTMERLPSGLVLPEGILNK